MCSNFSIFAFVKNLLLILLASVLATPVADDVYVKYIDKYSSIAVAEMRRTGVPASITLAQGLLESSAGQSVLAVQANNHFGIKCHADWKGKKMHRDDDTADECFRVYPTVEASFRDHSDFLRYRDRYKSLFELDPTDYKAWANGLSKAGYATDSKYAGKLIWIIEDYNLSRFDVDTQVPETTPEAVERPVEVKRVRVQEVYRFSLSRKVYEINGVPCVYAVEGDTYASLASARRLFEKELLRFNDLTEDRPLVAGELVYLKAKKNRAAKGAEKFIVGEEPVTLRDIAQRFGVKEAAIRRLNGLAADYRPNEGDTILLRRK